MKPGTDPDRLRVGRYAKHARSGERRLVIGYIGHSEEVTFSGNPKWEGAREWTDDGPEVVKT